MSSGASYNSWFYEFFFSFSYKNDLDFYFMESWLTLIFLIPKFEDSSMDILGVPTLVGRSQEFFKPSCFFLFFFIWSLSHMEPFISRILTTSFRSHSKLITPNDLTQFLSQLIMHSFVRKSCIPGSAVTEGWSAWCWWSYCLTLMCCSAVAVMKWEALLPNDTFLIVASSDGVFEKVTMQDVCDLMLYVKLGVKQELGSFAVTQQNLADYVVDLFL